MNMAINVNKIYFRQNIIFIISDINYQLSYIKSNILNKLKIKLIYILIHINIHNLYIYIYT